ncbi:MAG: TonB-dependent receptor [Acidobacteria bacterium]|nr:TonB-dependent receptor [Acidobacteriota bacterium]
MADENGVAVAGVEIVARSAAGQTQTVYTDEAGGFEFSSLSAGDYRVSLSKPGFFRLADQPVQLREGANEASFTLSHEFEIHETVEVRSTTTRIEPQEAAHQKTLVAHEIRDIPVPSSHDLRNTLPALPGVLLDHSGQLHVAGARAGQTEFLLDGFEIGNPATGDLTVRMSVDTVRAMTVETGRYGAQYAHAGAGVVALDTTAGDDRWRFGATNFIPDLNLERGVHFGNWNPRFTFSGPLRKGKAWFSDAVSIQHSFDLVREQPPGSDTTTQWGGDNLLRAQINLAPANLLQGSFLYNRSSGSHLGLGPFAPLSTTIDAEVRRYFVSVKDQISLKRTLIEMGAAVENRHAEILPMGAAPYVIMPSRVSGNFFETRRQGVRRWQALGSVILPSRHWHGSHDVQAGMNLAAIAFTQSAARNPIEFQRADTTLSQRSTFSGPAQFRLTNTQLGSYAQDSWRIAHALVVQAGLRVDWDRLLRRAILQPRMAANVLPFRDERTKLAVAWGMYYQPIDLAMWGQGFDQQQSDIFFDATGTIAVLGPVASSFVVPSSRLKQPRFLTTSAEWTQRIRKDTLGGIHFIHRNQRNGHAYEPQAPGPPGGNLRLQDQRRDAYRAVELWVRQSFREKAEVFGSYTRSRARSNEALDYSLGEILFAAQAPGPLAWDAPNRLVSWGWAPGPFWNLWLSYFLEYRSGFPFNVVNQQRQLVGTPGQLRFPDYLSINIGIEKRFRLRGSEWAARLSVINLTDHANPNAVVNNRDAPNFLIFAGGQRRAFTARLRLVGRK